MKGVDTLDFEDDRISSLRWKYREGDVELCAIQQNSRNVPFACRFVEPTSRFAAWLPRKYHWMIQMWQDSSLTW